MKKKMLITVGAMVAFIAVIGSIKFYQVKAAIAQFSSFAPPPEAVTTLVAKEEPWPETLDAIGSVVAVQGVTVSADLPGIVEKISFESGKRVGKGDLLVQLDSSQERAQLTAAESERKLAALDLERMEALRQKGVVSQSEYDRAQAMVQQTTARESEISATIERKRIRAPFAGVLGIRKVNLGQYLNAGDPVVPLQTLDPIYVGFAVPQQEVEHLKVGGELSISAQSLAGRKLEGKISAVDSVADEATRNVEVQATFENPKAELHPGMFVSVHLMLSAGEPAVTLPTSAINYAPYGDSVFVVEQMKGPNGQAYRGVRQQIVKLGGARGDQVAILTGVKPGEEVVTSGVFKLRPGAAVVVNNEVQPANEAAPKPEDS